MLPLGARVEAGATKPRSLRACGPTQKSKKTISYCGKDASGQVHQEGKVGATRWELDEWDEHASATCPCSQRSVHIAPEPTSLGREIADNFQGSTATACLRWFKSSEMLPAILRYSAYTVWASGELGFNCMARKA